MTIFDIFECILLVITVIFVIMFSVRIISDLVLSYKNLRQCDKVIRLTYEHFVRNYNLNPDRYKLDLDYLNMVSCKLNDSSSPIYIYFSPMDIIKVHRLKKN